MYSAAHSTSMLLFHAGARLLDLFCEVMISFRNCLLRQGRQFKGTSYRFLLYSSSARLMRLTRSVSDMAYDAMIKAQNVSSVYHTLSYTTIYSFTCLLVLEDLPPSFGPERTLFPKLSEASVSTSIQFNYSTI